MPLSFLTRLRGAIIVATFIFALFCLNGVALVWFAGTTLLVLPLLIWLLVSNSVRDAPPFDDSAFHRTRPVTNGQVFSHLVGFHLLVLAVVLAVLLAYCWWSNLGWREISTGMLSISVPWFALVSLFGIVASLATSRQHSKAWGFLALLLIPVLSFLGVFWYPATQGRHVFWPSLAGMLLAAAALYPPVWWLVAVKRRWLAGNLLGMAIGIAIPWLSLAAQLPDSWMDGHDRWRTPGLAILRLKEPAEAMTAGQAVASRVLEVRGLGPDEFIQIHDMTLAGSSSEPVLSEMSQAGFSADENGRWIPMSASLIRVAGVPFSAAENLPVWQTSGVHGNRHRLEGGAFLSSRSPYHNRGREPLSAATQALPWFVSGSTYRWVKVIDAPTTDGGRSRLPSGGRMRLFPLKEDRGDFAITLRVTESPRKEFRSYTQPPVIVARDSRGGARILELNLVNECPGFLVETCDYEFRGSPTSADRLEKLAILRDARLEVYWPEFRGHFQLTLPSPQ